MSSICVTFLFLVQIIDLTIGLAVVTHPGNAGQSSNPRLYLRSISKSTMGQPVVACKDDQYRCVDGPCLHRNLVCNGIKECPESDDEVNCFAYVPQNGQCPAGGFKCNTSERCIPPSQLCNGQINCLMADDESDAICSQVPGWKSSTASKDTKGQMVEHGGGGRSNHSSPGQHNGFQWNGHNVSQWNGQFSGQDGQHDDHQWKGPGDYQWKGHGGGEQKDGQSSDQHRKGQRNNGGSSNGPSGNQGGGQGDGSGGTNIDINKEVPFASDLVNSYSQDEGEPGFVFVNFGPIINGDRNVNGNGNDIGNGNDDGNGNGNGNGNNFGDKKVPWVNGGYN